MFVGDKEFFDFWPENLGYYKDGRHGYSHPADRDVLGRVEHPFDLNCLPGCWGGPIKRAPIILLYLSPGLSDSDHDIAKSKDAAKRFKHVKRGESAFPGKEHVEGRKWWKSRIKGFVDEKYLEDIDFLRNKIVSLNISPYHSKDIPDRSVLSSLPSCRMTLDWAQSTLFPEAEKGNKVVICMRSCRYWGLSNGENGAKYGCSLYAPKVTRGGHLQKDNEYLNSMLRSVDRALRK